MTCIRRVVKYIYIFLAGSQRGDQQRYDVEVYVYCTSFGIQNHFISPQPTNLAEGYCYPPFRPSIRPSVRPLTFEMQ